MKFFLIRLRNASVAELVFRAKQFYFTVWLKYLYKNNKNVVHFPDDSQVLSLRLPRFRGNITETKMRQILGGKSLSCNTNTYGRVFFSDSKLKNAFNDIRSLWEVARLQHLTLLLVFAYANPPLPISAKGKLFCKKAVIKWIKDNPFAYGPHYISSMECGLRIPVFIYCLKIIDSLSLTESSTIHEAIFLHAWFISNRLSLYSSLGNHTIAECVGLVFAGALFKKKPEGQKWIEDGVTLLKKELGHQVLKDGGPAEQSFNYHRFVLDLYWLAVDFLERNDFHDCVDIKPRLMRGEHFLAAFQDECGSMPAIGDSDDGFAVAPDIAPERSGTSGLKKRINIFEYSGYTVINTENRVTLTFDHGPLGMPPFYNHGHADALSITLTKEGRQVLVDPGTYRYNGVPEWRRYFKGTRAHNTVTIDGLDQAVQETGFIWSKPYNAELLCISEQNDAFLVKAVHDGYSRLRKKVWHQRSVLFFDKTSFLLKDSFSGEGIHKFELNYHLHPDAVLTKSHDWWLIDNHGSKVFVRLLHEGDFFFVRAQEDPPLGWYSPSYGIKTKSGFLSCIKTGTPGQTSFVTAMCTQAPLNKDKLEKRASNI